MVKCSRCEEEMLDEVSCAGNTAVAFPDGTILRSIPYNGEKPCHDCLTPPGGFHHPGCDGERCPRCAGQLISCGCLDEEDDE